MAAYLLILAGQSNAAGFGMSRATLPDEVAHFDFGPTFIFTEGASWWGQLQPGVNTNEYGAWGPEVGAAMAFRHEHPDDTLLIIKSAVGSTGVAPDPAALDWAPTSGPHEMFEATTRLIARAALAASGPLPTERTVLWLGGETDAYDPQKAAEHYVNLGRLVDGMESTWGAQHVVIARIGETEPYSLAVRQAEWQLDQDRADVASFKTIGFGMQPDGIHYDAQGQLSVGAGFFNAWEAQ